MTNKGRQQMSRTWRLLDTGVRTGAENMALDQTLLLAKSRGLSPNTVRFLQFSPPAVLVGYHQDVKQEIREAYCREAGIDINRRITGGGAILFDEAQVGWELIASSPDFALRPFSQAFHEKVCQAAIFGLRELGIGASFRPRNDIEVNGRKISGTGGVEEGNAFLFQGTLLVDFDVATMLRALRVPTEKLKRSSLDSAADRVTWVKKELGYVPGYSEIRAAISAGFEKVFGVRLEPGRWLPEEETLFRELLPRFRRDEWIRGRRGTVSQVNVLHGLHRTPYATIRAAARVDHDRKRVRSVLITGDMFISPRRTIYDLEARLKDVKLDERVIRGIVNGFWSDTKPHGCGIGPGDICAALGSALDRVELLRLGFDPWEVAHIFSVNGKPADILRKNISLLLLPYCSKETDCAYRRHVECVQCGRCTIGEAFGLVEAAGIKPMTIVSFEHLMEVLTRARQDGVEAYVGCCCEAFHHKHYADFQRAGLPGLLMDIEDSTCYELSLEHKAYVGEFENQTSLNIPLLRKVLSVVSDATCRTSISQS